MVLYKIVNDKIESKDVITAENFWPREFRVFRQVFLLKFQKKGNNSNKICTFPYSNASFEVLFNRLHYRYFELS